MIEEGKGTASTGAKASAATSAASAAQAVPKGAAPKPSLRTRALRAWQITKVVGTLALGGAIGGVIATLVAKAELADAQHRHEQRLAEQLEQHKPVAQRQQALLARRSLHQAISALEQRNFGTAERHIKQAGTQLAGPATGNPAYAELAAQLTSFRLLVSDDVSAQRAELLAFTQRFDETYDRAP